jgi:hypothetical protein
MVPGGERAVTVEGYAESEQEIQAVMLTQDFMRLRERLYFATEKGGRRERYADVLDEIRHRYGPRIAEGLDDWYDGGLG